MFQFIALSSGSTTSAPTQSLLSTFSPIIMLAVMFGLMWLLMIRPQRKKEKALRELVNSMTVGDKCITSGGIVGRVVNIKDDEVTIQSSVANTLITFKKSAISTVLKPASEE